MGNVVRLTIVTFNVLAFIFLKEEDLDLFISYLIIINILAFAVFYFFDFSSPFNKTRRRSLKIENDIKDDDLKTRTFKELKYSLSNVLNGLTILFPLVLLVFVKEHSYSGLDVVFSSIIFLHLLLNIMILSILIRNYFRNFYVLFIIIIGILFQIYNSLFELTKMNLFWFSVCLIIGTYFIIVVLSYFKINRFHKNGRHQVI